MANSTPISFDPNRFQTAASHYRTGRPAYAPALIRRVSDACGLRDSHRVLDLGCGPGQLAIGFSYFCGSITAVDPEPNMLSAAAELATGLAPQIRFVQGSSYDLGPHFGTFKLVTMGRSFHWMDRAATLKTLDALVEVDGAVVLFDDARPEVPENAWYQHFRAIVEKFAADDPARKQRHAPDWLKNEALLLGSAFNRLERIGVIERRKLAADALLDRAFSMSSTTRARLGKRADEMEVELKAFIQKTAVNGALEEIVESRATIARRPV